METRGQLGIALAVEEGIGERAKLPLIPRPAGRTAAHRAQWLLAARTRQAARVRHRLLAGKWHLQMDGRHLRQIHQMIAIRVPQVQPAIHRCHHPADDRAAVDEADGDETIGGKVVAEHGGAVCGWRMDRKPG